MKFLLNNLEEIRYELELSEAIYWSRFYEDQTSLKPLKMEIGNAMAFVLPGVDILAMNRVIGWGWSGLESAEEVKSIIDFYARNNCRRFFVQLSPLSPEAKKIRPLLKENGFRYYNSWSKLWRPIAGYNPSVRNFFECREIGVEHANEYGQILFESFDWADRRLIPFLSASVGKPGYKHYLLYLEGQAVAAGALHTYKKYGSMAFAATLPQYRGMGAQSLLIHRRLRDAYDLDLRYLFAETAMNQAHASCKSFQNLQKFGFDLAYNRENWIYTFDSKSEK